MAAKNKYSRKRIQPYLTNITISQNPNFGSRQLFKHSAASKAKFEVACTG
jgi:hypothetical protein